MRRVAGFLLVVAAATACGEDAPPATIGDPNFVRQANAICRETLPGLRAPDRKATSTTELRAATIVATAEGLADVANRLRDVPVRSVDRPRVDAWLEDWDRFVAVGRRYADAIADDDQDRSSTIDDEAVTIIQRIGRFARGNGIGDCVL